MSFHVIDPGPGGASKGLLPLLEVSVDFTNDPTNPTRVWTDITLDVRSLSFTRAGRTDPTQSTTPGRLTMVMNNRSGNYDPTNAAGVYYPGVKQTRWLRVRAQWAGVTYNRWQGVIQGIELQWPEAGKDATATVTAASALGVLNVFDLGSYSFAAERTDQRVADVCALPGLPTNLDTGISSVVVSGTFSYGNSALSHLQQVEQTENGRLFDDAGGTVVFQSRHWRLLNAAASSGTIGDAAGQIPYTEQAQLTSDDTNLWNLAAVTPSGGSVVTSYAAVSGTAHYPRALTRTLLTSDPVEAESCAQYLVGIYGSPSPKLPALTLKPARATGTWATVLSLANSQRATFKRAAAAAISDDGYVEQIGEAILPGSQWDVTVQLSAAADQSGWILQDAVLGVLGSTTVLVY